ncbi:MAG: indolepyruvate oxidoreductase subunit beta [Coriobacteriales bacterium]|jgi:indolepyruvate ferredoxin oxidoreductase beta subunit|nr:indolepyruvate oxidoreductase subunit beta [Coriobacteriales bacterium]
MSTPNSTAAITASATATTATTASAASAQALDIVVAGVGGQGTVLASKLLAQAALQQGLPVRTAETIGMAQRGGSVLGHVRIGESIASPLVPLSAADLIIGFEPGETVRSLPYLRPGGNVVTAIKVVEPVTATLSEQPYDGSAELAYLRELATSGSISQLIEVDGEAATAYLGSSKVLNVVLLGAASAILPAGLISLAALEQAIETLVKPQFIELNKRALAYSPSHGKLA